MIDPPVVLPPWAPEMGCPEPKEGESFRTYCERIEILPIEIFFCLEGDPKPETANARLALYLREYCRRCR